MASTIRPATHASPGAAPVPTDSRLAWVLARVTAMSPAEVLERGRHTLRVRADIAGRSDAARAQRRARGALTSARRPGLLLSRERAELVGRECPIVSVEVV